LVSGGAVKVVKRIFADTTRIDIFGQDGNDNLSVNEANCAMPAAHPLAHDPELPAVAVAALRAGGVAKG